jgi:hypothetical protein
MHILLIFKIRQLLSPKCQLQLNHQRYLSTYPPIYRYDYRKNMRLLHGRSIAEAPHQSTSTTKAQKYMMLECVRNQQTGKKCHRLATASCWGRENYQHQRMELTLNIPTKEN